MDNRSSSSASSSFRGSKELLVYATATTTVNTNTAHIANINSSSHSSYQTSRITQQWQHQHTRSNSITSNNNNGNRIKLCGYLKKKRNKVGGWRKMWFVLQDKLLLSYASKEEYDTKLVSFKDVLNLVPGTLVRPLGGFRFTIETTTQTMYTFHCEDRNAYREWITLLLESLTNNNNNHNNNNNSNGISTHMQQPKKFIQRFGHYSMDNIPSAVHATAATATPILSISHANNINNNNNRILPLAFCGFSNSFDSITQAQRYAAAPVAAGASSSAAAAGGAGCCVRLPIAQNTAKILERNGVSSCDLQQQQQKHHHQQQQQQQPPSSSTSSAFMICKRKSGSNSAVINSNSRDMKHFSVRYVQLPLATVAAAAALECNNNALHKKHKSSAQCTPMAVMRSRPAKAPATAAAPSRPQRAAAQSQRDGNAQRSSPAAARVTRSMADYIASDSIDDGHGDGDADDVADVVDVANDCGGGGDAAKEHQQRRQHYRQQQRQQGQGAMKMPARSRRQPATPTHSRQQQQQQQQEQQRHKRNEISVATPAKQCRRCNVENNSNAINGANQQQQQQQQHNNKWRRQRMNCDCNCACVMRSKVLDGGEQAETEADDEVAEGEACNDFDNSSLEKEMEVEMTECKALMMVRERVQRLSIRGALESSDCDCECDGQAAGRAAVAVAADEPKYGHQQQLKSKVTRTSSCTEQLLHPTESSANATPSPSATTEPIYAVVDLKHKYAQRKMRYAKKADAPLKRCNSYDSILQPYATAAAAAAAPVDSHKGLRGEKSLSYTEADDDIEGIYEDGDLFCHQQQQHHHKESTAETTLATDGSSVALATADDEENIYEPINVPQGNATEANTFWKYFTRLKVNSLLQLTRRMRHSAANSGGSPDYDTIKRPPLKSPPSSPTPQGSSSSSSLSSSHEDTQQIKNTTHAGNALLTPSHFSTIKRKFGTHRKSMQVRMRKFCKRKQSQNGDCSTVTASMMPTANALKSKSGKFKYRWKSVKIRATPNPPAAAGGGTLADETAKVAVAAAAAARRKSLFGSLPHMRRTRLTLFGRQFENGASKRLTALQTETENEL